MSDQQDSSQDKTEEPTEEKLRKAREEGQLARSKELQSAALVLGGGLLLLSSSHLGTFARELMHFSFTLDRTSATDPTVMISHLKQVIGMGFFAFLPFLFALWILGFISGMIPGGMNYSVKAMMPQAKRMNPLSGLKRMFSANSLTELLKSILKVILMIGISGFMLWTNSDSILAMNMMSLSESLSKSINILSVTMLLLGVGLLVISAIDVPFQMWSTKNKLKMSKQDVKDENKNNEGSPELKQRIRETQMKQSKRKIDEQVPQADVIIVNPTHYSIALKYDPEIMPAPYVIAKGVDEMAFRIREVAAKHDKAIVEAPELARAIYYSTSEEDIIPTGLYHGVVTVLRYVMELNAIKASGKRRKPQPLPQNMQIPESLKR